MLLIPFSPCRRYTDQNFILSSAFTWCGPQGDLFYSLILDVLKLQNGKKKGVSAMSVSIREITILKHKLNNYFF